MRNLFPDDEFQEKKRPCVSWLAPKVCLLVFLHDGRVEIDSNLVENRIRTVKLTTKNALFAGHDEGAHAWARIATLIETCKMNDVEPYAWLKSTLEKIADGHPQSRIAELLPWNFQSSTD